MIVIFRPQAVEDVVEAAPWYEAHAPGLGEQLIGEILAATRRAQENPELFRIVIAKEISGAYSRTAFRTGYSSQLSAKRFTSTPFCMARDMIADGSSAYKSNSSSFSSQLLLTFLTSSFLLLTFVLRP